MNRFVSGLLSAALVLSLAGGAGAEGMGNGKMMMHKCPRGKVWVAPYKTKRGKWVSGYCRKK